MEPIIPAKHRLLANITLIALCLTAFFAGLGNVGFIGPDEPRYAEIAREMVVTGDYISPRLCGCLWFEKPPLLYWLAAAGYHLFGVGEFAARAASAFCASVSVFMVFHAVGRVASLRSAMLSAAVLATSLLYIGYARACATDMPLAATLAVALLSFYLSATSNGRARTAYWMLGAAATGGAVLAKGLVGIVLVLATLGATWLITRRRIRPPSFLDIFFGILVFFAVVSIWYVPMLLEHGWPFVKEFFINHHFRRYVENRFQHPEPVYFFPFVVLAGAMPWTFFLLPAAARLAGIIRRDQASRDLLIALSWVWLVVTVAFFSFSVSKLPGYVLPAFPALAVILGAAVERLWVGERSRLVSIAAWLTVITLLAMTLALPIYIQREELRISGLETVIVWIPAIAALATAVLLISRRFRLFIAGTAIVTMCVICMLVYVIAPRIDDELSSRRFSTAVAESLKPGEKIAYYITKEYGPVFYSRGRVACGLRGEDVLNAYDPADIVKSLETEASLLVITRIEFRGVLEDNEALVPEKVLETERSVVVRVMKRMPAAPR